MFANPLRTLLIAAVTFTSSAPVWTNRGVTPEDYFAFEFVSGAACHGLSCRIHREGPEQPIIQLSESHPPLFCRLGDQNPG